MKKTYHVNVGNVGQMEYNSKKLALECFNTYVTLSRNNQTTAAGESVYLLENGEIIAEYIGEVDKDYSSLS